ncbi:MAG: hypothetical protein COV48_02700 [Elusimicrobia bacterium CG11_big_fil_rev_8_21_14_0_20_64_6]|nr:MAG: hypothetical protein COV48_02700 [Elusimicrobia bacterium CG11_big_fil_rev_8_21_14_0_20_64_6]
MPTRVLVRPAWLVIAVFFIGCLPIIGRADRVEPKHETVVLLHGMGRTRAAMMILAWRFEKAGYETLNFPYGQKSSSLNEISDALTVFLEKNVRTPRYHFIGHSLGNIIVRNALRKSVRPGLGRIVMLAPPNRAAHLAKLFKDNRLYRWIMGDSGQRLADDEFYKTLPAPAVEFGVIAGDRGQSLTFDEPNDGIVAVATTRLEGMKAFVIVHHTHTLLVNTKDAFLLSKRFLESGSFEEKVEK